MRAVMTMPKKYEKFEDLPPAIQEGLKKRGWTWPFTEEFKRQRLEEAKRFKFTGSSLEALADMAREDGDWEALRYYEEQIKKRQQERNDNACGTTDVS